MADRLSHSRLVSDCARVPDSPPEAPAPVRALALALSGWIGRLGAVWVEGQVAQLTRRPGLQTVFLAGDVWPLLLPSIGAMLLLGSILFAIVVRKTRKSLEV